MNKFSDSTPFQHKRYRRWGLVIFVDIILIGLLLPEEPVIPVKNATRRDWNQQSFWYYPWGKSVVHKGIDIFAPEGREVIAATGGLVIWQGELGMGGKAVVVLGPKWHCHYYAHLRNYQTNWLAFIKRGKPIGSVGTTGNAVGKAPHLHYTIFTLLPYPWRWDSSIQGWRKMFYLNPDTLLP